MAAQSPSQSHSHSHSRNRSTSATAWGCFPHSKTRQHHAQRREHSAPGKVNVSHNPFMVHSHGGVQESLPGRDTVHLGHHPLDPDPPGPGEYKISAYEKIHKPDPFAELGFQASAAPPHPVIVKNVQGWAKHNGVQNKDELVSVQGRKTTDMQNMNELVHALQQRPLHLKFKGSKQEFVKDAFQITVCYVKNLKRNDWSVGGRRQGPFVNCELEYADAGGRKILKAIPDRPMFSRPDKAMSADWLNKSARNALPLSFERTGIIQSVPQYFHQKFPPASAHPNPSFPKLRFHIKEDGMFGRGSDLCKPLELDTMEQDARGQYSYLLHPKKLRDECLDRYLQDPSGVEMKVRIAAVKSKGEHFTALIEERGYKQRLEVLAILLADAEEGQTEMQVSPDTQKTAGIKAGDNIFIAPEVDGKREMRRIMKFVQRDKLHYIHLDARLKHSHGMGTTLAIRSRAGGWCSCPCCPSLGSWCNSLGLHCFENCKICVRDCGHGASTTCICGYASCCICCIELWRVWAMACNWCLGRNSLIDLRRQCARRCSLPYDPAVADDGDKVTGCCCVPLRTAIFMLSLFSVVVALIAFLEPNSAEGLAVSSHMVSGVVEIAGFFFGALGAIGAWELQANLLVMYNYFQIARLLAKCYMMYTDAPLLLDCELWRTDINAAIKKYGWNPSMYNMAMENYCSQSLLSFVIINTFLFWLYVYLISLTRKLIWFCETAPKYLLSMPKEAPSGVFRTVYRTQGKSRPPYGAIDGDDLWGISREKEHSGLVGAPVGLVHKPALFDPNLSRAPGKRPMQFNY